MNLSIFRSIYNIGDTRIIRKNGKTTIQECKVHIGVIPGVNFSIPALVKDGYTEQDNWYVVNLMLKNLQAYPVAVLGTLSEDDAVNWAIDTFSHDFEGDIRIGSVLKTTYFAISRLLSDKNRLNNKRITQVELEYYENRSTAKVVVWNENNDLTSHTPKELLQDMLQHDPYKLANAKTDIQAIKTLLMVNAEIQQFDSVISQAGRLKELSERLLVAMDKLGNEKLKAVNVDVTEPFKKHGVVNVAIIFEMSDGQTITVIFHNSDTTPKKLENTHLVTSWKWQLNKRDVTAVLQPKSGRQVNLADLAKRMFTLAETNSESFKKNQIKKQQAQQVLDNLKAYFDEKLQQEKALDEEILALQQKLNTPLPNVKNTQSITDQVSQILNNTDTTSQVEVVSKLKQLISENEKDKVKILEHISTHKQTLQYHFNFPKVQKDASLRVKLLRLNKMFRDAGSTAKIQRVNGSNDLTFKLPEGNSFTLLRLIFEDNLYTKDDSTRLGDVTELTHQICDYLNNGNDEDIVINNGNSFKVFDELLSAEPTEPDNSDQIFLDSIINNLIDFNNLDYDKFEHIAEKYQDSDNILMIEKLKQAFEMVKNFSVSNAEKVQ